jgi:acetyl-CoA acyltransferase
VVEVQSHAEHEGWNIVMTQRAVIVDLVRTASGRGKPGGGLSSVHPVTMLSTVLTALVERSDLDPAVIEDVIAGCVSQSHEQAVNIGRQGVLAAGWPEHIPATTIDRQCGSSQQAIHFAAQAVIAGVHDVVVACGVESMSRVPIGAPTFGMDVYGPEIAARYAPGLINQGVSAELIAQKWDLSRDDLDAYAERSHRLAAEAEDAGEFARDIVPVDTTAADASTVVFDRDETLRRSTTLESLARLSAAFESDEMRARYPELLWNITPGNSSPLTDGASAALIMSEEAAAKYNLTPRAAIHTMTITADDPIMMLTAPIPATRKAMAKSGLSLGDIDVYEVNEAFASVPLAWAKEFGADMARLNPRGGAIALGHPLGASGIRLMSSLIGHLESTNGRFGLQTMCEGGGMANATIVERLG